MRKFRRFFTVLLTGAMLLGLCACGGGGQTGTGAVVPTEWQTVADVDALELVLDYTEDEYVAQIPQFKEADGNDVLTAMNKRLLEKGDQWKQAVASDGGFLQLIPMVKDTTNYLSVVLFEQEIPNYGTDGKAMPYVYDKLLNTEVDEDLAWSLAGATDDGIADAIAAYCREYLNEDGVEYRWLSFGTDAYYMDSDDKMALVLSVSIKRVAEDDETADKWNYLLTYKGGKIIGRLTDDLAQVK